MIGGSKPEAPRYNPIFEHFVPANRANDNVRGLIAYGLYKIAKREWSQSIQDRHARQPTPEEREAYIATWTPSRLAGLEQQADVTLAAFGSAVVDAATPDIREDALRGTTSKAIGTSVSANGVYTLILIVFALILYLAGIDLIGFVQKFRPPGG